MINLNEIITVSEAADIYNVDVSTIRKLLLSNKLKENIDFRKSKATWLIRKEALNKYMQNKKKN